jgi:hypothetical protein
LGFLARAIRQEEEIIGEEIGKEIAKLSLFADDTILETQKPHQKLLDTINTFSKVE